MSLRRRKLPSAKEPIVGSEELSERGNREEEGALRRLIPVPRRILTIPCSDARQPSVAKTIIAYLIRGLSRRRDGSINNRGSVKSSWIAMVAGICLSAAKAARSFLIALGLITKDTQSHQFKLNRSGAFFEINTAWEEMRHDSEFGLPTVQNNKKFGPPMKEIKTLTDLNNQKTLSGASKNHHGEPTLNDIQRGDLKRMSNVLVLYRQAVKAGWLQGSEANQLFFIAAAIRVHRTNCNDPVRVFVSIIKQDLRSYVTQGQEDSAREQLRVYREKQQRRRPGTQTQNILQRGGFMQSLVSEVIQHLPGCRGRN